VWLLSYAKKLQNSQHIIAQQALIYGSNTKFGIARIVHVSFLPMIMGTAAIASVWLRELLGGQSG
jgi:hypothetical protein